MAATVPIEFTDGDLSASGTVTLRLGRLMTVNGKLVAGLYLESHDLKVTRQAEQESDA